MRPICDAALDIIWQFEGCKLKAYRDQKGVLTVGVGCTHHVREGMVIGEDEARERLKEDSSWIGQQLAQLLGPRQVNDEQFGAMCSLIYNIGIGNFRNSLLLHCVRMGNFEGAALEFLRFNKIDGQLNDGLARRRAAEKALFEKSL